MTHATGIVTRDGAAVRVGAAVLPLPRAHTAVGEFIAAMVARIDAGELQPCRYCGAYFGCDCEDWLEWMAADNNRLPLDVMTSDDIPF